MHGIRRVFRPRTCESKHKIPRLSGSPKLKEEEKQRSKSRSSDEGPSKDRSTATGYGLRNGCSDMGNALSALETLNSPDKIGNSIPAAFPLGQLPVDALLHIFTFLGQNDRLRMSEVCRGWHSLVFSSPRLWRRRQLTLRCSRHSEHSRRACFYARRLGKYLHKLTVACEHPGNHSCRSMAVCFRKLLTSLKTPLALSAFKVTDLRLRNARPPVLGKISSALETLLLSIQRLKSFQMSDAHWPAEEGVRVISSVLSGSRHSLQALKIDGFFMPRFMPSEATEVLAAGLGELSSLTKLSIDYFYLSEEMVLALAASRQGHLRSLKLVACDVSPHSRFVSKFAWATLTSYCPSLRVEFCVQGFTVSPARSLPLLLSPALRVSKIRLAIGGQYTYLNMPRLNIASVLAHVTKHYRRRLIRFEMDVDNHNDLLDAALIRMVRKCRNLVSVKVTAYFNHTDTDVIVRELVRARREKQMFEAGSRPAGQGEDGQLVPEAGTQNGGSRSAGETSGVRRDGTSTDDTVSGGMDRGIANVAVDGNVDREIDVGIGERTGTGSSTESGRGDGTRAGSSASADSGGGDDTMTYSSADSGQGGQVGQAAVTGHGSGNSSLQGPPATGVPGPSCSRDAE